METIDQQSRFQFDLKQNCRAMICTVENLFPDFHKRAIQYLVRKSVSDLTAKTTLCQEHDKGFQQIILYLGDLDNTLNVRRCRSEKGKKKLPALCSIKVSKAKLEKNIKNKTGKTTLLTHCIVKFWGLQPSLFISG